MKADILVSVIKALELAREVRPIVKLTIAAAIVAMAVSGLIQPLGDELEDDAGVL